jgi:hypothetical protein
MAKPEEIIIDRFNQILSWNTNSYGYSKCIYSIIIEYDKKVFRECKNIIVNNKDIESIQEQIKAERIEMLKHLVETINNYLPLPEIKQNFSNL